MIIVKNVVIVSIVYVSNLPLARPLMPGSRSNAC
jgi:hypothetical protein